MKTWVRRLRDLHDESFALDWSSHLEALSRSLSLGSDPLATPAPGLPPSWFVGDVEAIEPGRWVLVVSLNQAYRPDDEWHLAQHYTAQTYWDHWRDCERHWMSARAFYRAYVLFAAATLGVKLVTDEDEADFAARSLVFLELCPYSSRTFRIGASDLARLAAEDRGFRIATDVRWTLIREARPALVALNGLPCMATLEQIEAAQLSLGEPRSYESVSRRGRALWHREGRYLPEGRRPARVPVVGFPFLRKPRTHNSYDEIRQLGRYARALVER